MNTLRDIAESLRQGRKDVTDVELATKAGLTRQSVSRALSGVHNFNVTTLLAIAETNDQVVMLVPREMARALAGANLPRSQGVSTMTDELRSL